MSFVTSRKPNENQMRTKAFDIDQVLDKAVRIFWLKGYEATTIPALEIQMGIKRQSLYNTFGNKHSLFLSALKRYHDQIIVENFAQLLTTSSPKRAIKDYFYQRIKGIRDPNTIDGCLITNSLTELGLSDQEVKKQTKKTLEYMEQVFYKAIMRAQDLGEVDSSKNAELIAMQLLNNAQGLFVLSKSGTSRKKLNTLVEQFLTILD
jgi:TetR/AcrR family transcriptional repressor of nem operon